MKENGTQTTSLQRFFEEDLNVCIRAQVVNGEPCFVAKDVCQALDIRKYRDAIARLEDYEKGHPVIVDTLGGVQKMATVNEYGFYSIILLSRKPNSKEFKKWLVKEVLPTLRKTGMYIMPSALQRNGVDGIFYKGKKFFPYLDILRSTATAQRADRYISAGKNILHV